MNFLVIKGLKNTLFPCYASKWIFYISCIASRTACINCQGFFFNIYIHFLGLQEEGTKDMKRRLKSARQYLKTDYKIHLERESPCPDHCRQFASSSSEPEFHGSRAHQHTVNCCDRCEDLKNVIADLQLAFDAEEVKFRWLYVFTVDTIWFPHNLRFVLEWHEKCMQMRSTICN